MKANLKHFQISKPRYAPAEVPKGYEERHHHDGSSHGLAPAPSEFYGNVTVTRPFVGTFETLSDRTLNAWPVRYGASQLF